MTVAEKKPYLVWDTCDNTKARADYYKESLADHDWVLGGTDFATLWEELGGDEDKFLQIVKEQNEEQELDDLLFRKACEDVDASQWDWDAFTENLTELMKEVFGDKTEFRAEVTGFGWQSRSGHKEFSASTGEELLRQILPDTECTFNIFKGDGELRIQNSHHDAPTGNEWYTIKPQVATEED